ncbi:MAG: DUF3737 family protein [Oscillospiraceae bacterium]|nr:DUF3737 family protein [Oscillospiraceae bacterium]
METIVNQTMDEERALYGRRDLTLRDCVFAGSADGESALKECANIVAENVRFCLRYPCWHDHGVVLRNCELTDTCRAPFWYSQSIHILNSRVHGVKAVRECSNVELLDSDINSPEFGWSTRNITLRDCSGEGDYFLLRGENLRLDRVKLRGKYAFQYTRGGLLTKCELETKDAFWHAMDLTITDCVIRGEYLGWYSHNLTFINCTIIGTQPFCYCSNLRLIDCRMREADLSFERSHVHASLTEPILSIKNPLSGIIYVPEAGEIIRDIPEARGEVRLGEAAPASKATGKKRHTQRRAKSPKAPAKKAATPPPSPKEAKEPPEEKTEE